MTIQDFEPYHKKSFRIDGTIYRLNVLTDSVDGEPLHRGENYQSVKRMMDGEFVLDVLASDRALQSEILSQLRGEKPAKTPKIREKSERKFKKSSQAEVRELLGSLLGE